MTSVSLIRGNLSRPRPAVRRHRPNGGDAAYSRGDRGSVKGWPAASSAAGRGWWTRSQRLRTVALVLIEAEFTQPVETPVYQSIATRVGAMCDRGVRVSAIAKHFAVDHHTVDKALRWFRSR